MLDAGAQGSWRILAGLALRDYRHEVGGTIRAVDLKLLTVGIDRNLGVVDNVRLFDRAAKNGLYQRTRESTP